MPVCIFSMSWSTEESSSDREVQYLVLSDLWTGTFSLLSLRLHANLFGEGGEVSSIFSSLSSARLEELALLAAIDSPRLFVERKNSVLDKMLFFNAQ